MAQDHSNIAAARKDADAVEDTATDGPAPNGLETAAVAPPVLPPPLAPGASAGPNGPPPLPASGLIDWPDEEPAAASAKPSRDTPATELPPLPKVQPSLPAGGDATKPSAEDNPDSDGKPASERRTARRRAAGPSRDRIAANDDAPSIGGLIYALNQRPSKRPFGIAGAVSAAWAVLTLGFGAFWLLGEIGGGATLASLLGRPEMLMLLASLLGPIGLFFAFAVMAYRSEELRLRSSAMTEVAVRLAEPDRMAEQSVASLGQAVRRQVSFMNDAVARALGRAGELEALVHNEVSALERSYEENERKIRSLIQELVGEREALVNTSDRVSGTLQNLGKEVPELIEKLSTQQIKLASIIEGAGQNLTALESAIAQQTGNLETALGDRAHHLEAVLGEYTQALSSSLDTRMEQIGTTIASRTGELQVVFEEYTRALDTTLATRADSLDATLAERAEALDGAFQERLRLFDESILRSTLAIDSTIGEKATALTSALDYHAKTMGESLARQSIELDESLLQGINAVRRTSENITRQSIKAIEGLASQSDLLKNVSENLLSQINSVTNRFENQGQQILRAANALESANYKIDHTLQTRHAELTDTLDRISGKADELGSVAHGYSRQIEGSISDAERRTRSLTAELAQSAEERSRATLAEIERLKTAASDNTTRALEDLRSRFSNVSQEVTQSLGTLTNQFTETTGQVRQRTAQAAQELAGEQERLRSQIQSLPGTTRESAEQMRKMLQDQLRALDQLSTLTQREASARDVSRPVAPLSPQAPRPLVPVATSPATREEQARALSTLSSALSQELQVRAQRQAAPSPSSSSNPAQMAPQPADSRDGWSLGDLLKRASQDEASHPAAAPEQAYAQVRQPQPQHQHYQGQHQPQAGAIDFAAMARALDPATAAAIWQRLGAGQTGIMVRSIYTPEGRALFDDTVARLQTDPSVQHTVQTYLADFERVLQEADRQDPSGQTAQAHLASDYGRVYLLLAHASGRIT